jgi:hypothetical protein
MGKKREDQLFRTVTGIVRVVIQIARDLRDGRIDAKEADRLITVLADEIRAYVRARAAREG